MGYMAWLKLLAPFLIIIMCSILVPIELHYYNKGVDWLTHKLGLSRSAKEMPYEKFFYWKGVFYRNPWYTDPDGKQPYHGSIASLPKQFQGQILLNRHQRRKLREMEAIKKKKEAVEKAQRELYEKGGRRF